MHVHIINPNTTGRLSDASLELARAVAAPGTTVSASQPVEGTPSVECHVDEAVASLGVLEEIRRLDGAGIDAFVIACFGDTGVMAARELSRVPVVGMTEAALMTAALIARRFSIVTLPERTRVHAERSVDALGLRLAGRCLPIRAIDVPVLHEASDSDTLLAALCAEAFEAVSTEGAEAVILGCAGLAHLAVELESTLGVPIVEGVSAAIGLSETLIRCGLRTSRRSTFATPAAKPLSPRYASLLPANET